jgi:hypothetical protein
VFRALGQGDVVIELPNGSAKTTFTLKDVLYSPDMCFTLISLSRMVRADFKLEFDGCLCIISSPKPNRRVVTTIPESGGLYRIPNPYPTTPSANAARVKMTISQLHRRMGHISAKAAKYMVKSGMVTGIDLDMESEPEFCTSCMKTKIVKGAVPKSRSEANRAKKYSDRIHSGLWGPAQVQSINGSSYFVTYTDEATALTERDFLKKKSETTKSYRELKTRAETQREVTFREFHSDGGVEMSSPRSCSRMGRNAPSQCMTPDSRMELPKG